MKATTTIFFVLSCLASAGLVSADDSYYSNSQQGFSVCDNTAIEVTNVQLYCDSPGTFYYGSGKYRNSLNCTAGDKGKYVVDFYINDADSIASNGSPVLEVSATSNIGWNDNTQKVLGNEDLCSLDSLKSLSGSVCPAAGKYRLKSNFYFDDSSNTNSYYSSTFTPTLSVGFKSSVYQNTFDYGGANTKYCSGTNFFTPPLNHLKKIYANSVTNFFKSFGILLFTIAVMGSFIWFMIKRPRSFQDARSKMIPRRNKLQILEASSSDDSSYSNSENFDFNKMKSPTANQSFLDF